MKISILALIVAGGLALAGTPAFADADDCLTGSVVRVNVGGVYLQTDQGVTYVPAGSTTYIDDGNILSMGDLTEGRKVDAYYSKDFSPYYMPVEYLNLHRDWDWDQNRRGWESERTNGHERDGH